MDANDIRGKELIPIGEFAKAISLSVREVYRMIDRKQLPPQIKQGKLSFLLREDLDAYIEGLKQQRS